MARHDRKYNMKTIAITIDEETLRRLRGWAGRVATGDPGGRGPRQNLSLSKVVREAVREYLDRAGRAEAEARDREAIARNRDVLRRQAKALVEEQAKP